MTIAINWSLAKCSCPSWSANTDESALRSSLANLDECNSSLHWWLGFWTFLVALGVVLEVVFVAWEYLDELHDFRRGIIHAPDRPQTVLFVLGLLGAGLVAAGVSGEFWKESQIATVETCIRKGNDALFLLLSKEAGDAKLSAASAEASAKEADIAAGKAQEKVGAVAKRAEDIDADLARTQYLLSGRSVTDSESLVKQLKQYKGQTVHFGSYNSEPDESLLCNQLAAAARLAEMNVQQDACGRLLPIGNPLTGVVISGPDIPQTVALAQIILHTSNLGPGGAVSAIKAPELNILVGAKPPFEIAQARGVKAPAKKQAKKNIASNKR